MPKRFSWIALTLALAVEVHSSAQEPVLDLVAQRTPSETATKAADDLLTVPGGVIGVVGRDKPVLPLRLSLTALDRGAYRLGDDAVYEVTIENVGAGIVRLPWTADNQPFRRTVTGARVATVSLVIDDPELATYVIALQAFYGADSVAGSVLDLQPGHKVRVRAGGPWSLPLKGQSARLLTNPSLPVRARLDVYAPEGHYKAVGSENQIDVTLSR